MLSLAATPSMGQSPHTADGRPDLQDVWDFRTMTPLQRPTALGEQAFLTDEKVAAQEAGVAERNPRLLESSEVRTAPLPAGGGGKATPSSSRPRT
jgi:hypothetical protein